MSLQDNRQKRAIILLALGDYIEKARLRYGGQSQKAADASKLAGAASRLVILLDQSDGPRKQSNSPSPTSASSPTKGGSTKRNAGGMKASQDREAGKSQRKSAKSVKAQQVDEEDEDEDETEDEGGKDEDAEQVDSPRVALRSSTRQRALIKSQKTTPEPTVAKDRRERHAKRSPSPSSSSSDDIQEDDAPFFVEVSPVRHPSNRQVQAVSRNISSPLKARAKAPAAAITEDGDEDDEDDENDEDDEVNMRPSNWKAQRSPVKTETAGSSAKGKGKAVVVVISSSKDEDVDELEEDDSTEPPRAAPRHARTYPSGSSSKRPAAEDVEMDLLDKQQLELDRQFNVLSQRKYEPTMDDWKRFSKALVNCEIGIQMTYRHKAFDLQSKFPKPRELDDSPHSKALRKELSKQLRAVGFPRPKWLENS